MANPLLHIRKRVFGMTQAEMACVAQVSQGTVSRWESGTRDPDREEMRRIRTWAIRRKLPWDDRLFFEVPAEAAE